MFLTPQNGGACRPGLEESYFRDVAKGVLSAERKLYDQKSKVEFSFGFRIDRT